MGRARRSVAAAVLFALSGCSNGGRDVDPDPEAATSAVSATAASSTGTSAEAATGAEVGTADASGTAAASGSASVTEADPTSGSGETEGCGAACPSFEAMRYTLEVRGPGTEVNHIVAHEGALFATMSVWNTPSLGTEVRVLRKDGPAAPWVPDGLIGQSEAEYYSRAEVMTRVRFDRDGDGRPLQTPAELLVLGAGQQSADPGLHPWRNTVWTRRGSEDWVRTVVSDRVRRPCDDDDKPTVRSLAVHTDAAGHQALYVGTGSGTVWRATYDPEAAGLLRFDDEPLLQGSGRVTSLASAAGRLYATVSMKDRAGECDARGGLPEGLLRLRDPAPDPETIDVDTDPLGAFELVDVWETDSRAAEDSCRGLTVLPHPTVPGELALYGGLEDAGRIVYWDGLAETPVRHTEIVLIDAIRGLGAEVTGGYRIGPYNEFTPATDPSDGRPIHLIGLYVRATSDDVDGHFLVRGADASYRYFTIPSPDGGALRGVRTTIPSPWPEEAGRVVYFGGFDAHDGPHDATGWIVRGEVEAGR